MRPFTSGLRHWHVALLVGLALALALAGCGSEGDGPDAEDAVATQVEATISAHQTATAAAASGATETPTPPTPSSTPMVVCTPPACGPDEDYFCPDECPGGCGTVCATVTPVVEAPDSDPQRIERVQFAPGATEDARSGMLNPRGRKSYVLRAAAGQLMFFLVTAEDAPIDVAVKYARSVFLEEGYYNSEFDNYWTSGSYTLPSSGDYIVELSNAGDAATNYDISFSITDEAVEQDEPPERVQFPPGGNATTLQGDLAGGATKRYVLQASEGQLMFVAVTSPASPVGVSVFDPNGMVVAERLAYYDASLGAHFTLLDLQLPRTGDYIVALWRDSPVLPPTAYSVEFFIQ